jgi:hypothetical protein
MMALTPEQQAALDELMAHLPPPKSAESPVLNVALDALQTWLGISPADVRAVWEDVLARKANLHGRWLTHVERNPLEAAFEFIGAATLAFYLAEKDENPKIKTYIDAFYYIATCASVGYADIFAVTQTGRAVASLVMMVGPALAARTLERPQSSTPRRKSSIGSPDRRGFENRVGLG